MSHRWRRAFQAEGMASARVVGEEAGEQRGAAWPEP